MKNLLLLALITFFISCDSGNRYTYIEVIRYEDSPGDSSTKFFAGKSITGDSDSAAYLMAYGKYIGSVLAGEKMRSTSGNSRYRTTGFILNDRNGNDIVRTVRFNNKSEKEKEIEQEIRDSVIPFLHIQR